MTVDRDGSEPRRGSLGLNAAALYTAHATGVVLSLLAVPFLARVLRPEGWGVVVFAQSFAAVLTLVLEYGFYLSATREIARCQGDRDRVARIVAEVQSAKLILLALVTAVAAAACVVVPLFAVHPWHLLWAWVFAVSQGFSAYWYYQGVERPTYPALAEAGSKAVATALLFATVRSPADGPLVLAIYGSAAFAWMAVTNALIYRSVPFAPLRLAAGARMLRETFRLFAFRAASGVYVSANSFIVGGLASPQVVAFFGGAERVVRGAINGLHPATQAVYPRVSHLLVHDRKEASRLLGLCLLVVGGLGAAIGTVAAAGAPWLVRIFLGAGYEPAVPVLRTLALLAPVVAVSTVIGLHWALPMGLERPYFRLVLAGGALNVGLAVGLVPRFGAPGMAGGVLAVELFVLGGLIALAWRHGREFWIEAMRSAAGEARGGFRRRVASGARLITSGAAGGPAVGGSRGTD